MGARDELSGRVLGEFVLRERIGEGGFGAVYRCEQPLLGREAVIKVLHHGLRGSDVVLQRFTREAQLASRLDHPYAAHIYAFGVEKDDGLCWIAMELVAGTTLDRWLRDRGPLPIAQLVPFFERVAEVVQTAHEAGIVHRDLKPSNIMVIERAGRLLPKLLDFGIAKLMTAPVPPKPRPAPRAKAPSVQGDAHTLPQPALQVPMAMIAEPAPPAAPPPAAKAKPSEIATLPPDPAAAWTGPSGPSGASPVVQLTKDDATMGSPPYMSPEQWQDAMRVGPSSDLYALGIVAFEALTGRRPFVATSLTALAQMHCRDPVPAVGDGYPVALDRFFARALAKAPEERPATALELAATLRVAAGIGSAPEDLPRLDESVRDAWLAEGPQPLAESVSVLDGARNLHQARDAARDVFRGLVRYLLAIALAARAQVRGGDDPPAIRELLRGLRARELDEDERVKLLRLLVQPFVDRRGAHPVPELVDLLARGGALDALLELSPSTDHGGTEDVVRSQLVQFLPALAKLLRAAAFVLDYALIVPADRLPERWTGLRRQRRAIAVVRGGRFTADRALLLDRDGKPALELWPLVQAIAPAAGVDRELFVLDGRGRLGARLTAAPAGYEHHDPAVWDWFAEHVLGELEGGAALADDARPPYLGLASFSTGDADRFVGREREIDAFVNRLRKAPLQIVVGPSGAGKSSFVHAGVVANLPAGWRVVSLRPGMSPLTALATRLAAAGVSAAQLRPVLESAPAAAAALVQHAAGDGAIVVVVDQLEELFTLCAVPAEREAFASVLAHLSAAPDGATRVICTVRDDFLMQVGSLPPLRAQLSPALFLIGNPSRDDLVRTIVEPARRIGFELSDADLARDMVDVVADRPGALALLSFTASRLWELRDRRFQQLTRKAYDAMGGVAGALGQHAEATFTSLVADEQRVAREAFRYLVTADMTRAVLPLDELRQRLASPRADAVIGKLVDARLLSVVEGDDATQIEIVHEALIAAWPRLGQWAREDTADAQTRGQIRAAAKQWADRQRPRELLWRGDLLVDLRRARGKLALTDVETAFADASRADAARGTRLRRAIVAVAIALTAVFVIVLARANSSAQASRKTAEDLLRDSTFDQGRLRMLAGDKLGALPFLARAYQMGETGAANRLMIEEALRPTRARVLALEGHTDKLWQAVYSPDGKLIATASLDGTARIWDADTGAQRDVIKLGGEARAVAFSPDGKLLAIGGRDPAVHLWDLAAHAQIAALPVPNRVLQLAFSPDGARLVAAGNAVLRAWTLADRSSRDLVDDSNDHSSIAFSRDGSRLVTWQDGGHVALRDAATLAVVTEHDTGATITACAIDPHGGAVAIGTEGGELQVLRADGNLVTRPRAHGDAIGGVAFAPDGLVLVSASVDGRAELWTADAEPIAVLDGHGAAVTRVRFSPRGELVATAYSDGSARLWTATTGTPRGELVGHTSGIYDVDFRFDGARVVTASWDHRAVVWDVPAALQFRAVPTPRLVGTDPRPAVRYSPDGGRLALVDASGALVVTGGEHATPCRHPVDAPIYDFAWSPDGGSLATFAFPSRAVTIVDASTCQARRELAASADVGSVAFTASGQLAIGMDAALELWDPGSGRALQRRTGYPGNVMGLDVTADGGVVASTYAVDQGSTVVVEGAGSGTTRRTLLAGRAPLSGVVLDARRHRVLASSFDQHVYMWDADTGARIATLEGSGPLWSVRLAGDDRAVVGVGGNSPMVWNADTGARLAELQGSTALTKAGAFLSGDLFITAGGDGIARVWDVATSRPLLAFTGAQTVDVDTRGTHVVLSSRSGAREWLVMTPVPDGREIDRWAAEVPR